MDWLSYVSGVVSVPIIAGLSVLLGKFWANRILEKDRAKYQTQMDALLQDLRTRDSKELFVHRLQFEKEFEIYKDLWTNVLALGRAGSHFRMLQSGPFKPHDEIIQEFSDSHNALIHLVYDNRPFYAPSIFDIAKGVLDSAYEISNSDYWRLQIEQKSKQSDKKVDKLINLDKKIRDNLDEINDSIGRMSDAIRKRIWSTKERGWDRDA